MAGNAVVSSLQKSKEGTLLNRFNSGSTGHRSKTDCLSSFDSLPPLSNRFGALFSKDTPIVRDKLDVPDSDTSSTLSQYTTYGSSQDSDASTTPLFLHNEADASTTDSGQNREEPAEEIVGDGIYEYGWTTISKKSKAEKIHWENEPMKGV